LLEEVEVLIAAGEIDFDLRGGGPGQSEDQESADEHTHDR
jgi:hypothetical protein